MPLTPLRAIVGRAFASVARHAALYAVLAAVLLAAFALCMTQWHAAAAPDMVDFTLVPIFDTVVAAFALADLRGESAASAVWLRVLERCWAPIVIEFVAVAIAETGIASLAGGLLGWLYAVVFFLFSVLIVYAPVVAVVDDSIPWWLLVWRPFGLSMRAAIGTDRFTRATFMFVLQFIPSIIEVAASTWLTRQHHAIASPWIAVPAGILIEAPLVTLLAFAYFDAAGMSPKDACSE